ncbi:MAG TPA: GAF domain-containing SpoIIE family protein phosphatase [Mycobacteriales bacterium]|nr:GAF domain-containing SpoIIE family protein phosphatase [Mycobacteriales bacterium]
MTTAQVERPPDEAERMAAVRRFEVLDTPADGAFDHITAMAARLLRTPIAIISIVDTDRIWFKSRHGLPDVSEIERVPGLCASAILDDRPWVVTDAANDPRTLANPLVAGSFGLRFYAGVPLTTSEGHNLGTLCVIDKQPREIDDGELDVLSGLATLVVDQLELRLQAREVLETESELRREAERLADVLQASLLPPHSPTLPGMELATRFLAGERGLAVGGDFYDVFRRGPNDWALLMGDVCGKGAHAAALAASARWTVRASAGQHVEPERVLRDLNGALAGEAADDSHYLTAVFARLELDTCGAWLTFVSAGHPLPVLVRRSGLVERRGEPSPPAGMFAEVAPVVDRVGLGPGDSLVLFTDGVTEARAPGGDMYGEERLIEVLAGATGSPAEALADRVVQDVMTFCDRQLRDDLAIMVIRVPEDAREDALGRVADATGVPAGELQLPGYPHGSPAA